MWMPRYAPWLVGNRLLDGTSEPVLLGVINCTPDSFFDEGRYFSLGQMLARAKLLVQEGAQILDIGGESTRPGAKTITVEEECARVLPLIETLANHPDFTKVVLSIDTQKAAVARVALQAGAQIVNDVSALTDPCMAEVIVDKSASVVLNHMRGTPPTMQESPAYGDVVKEVKEQLCGKTRLLESLGVPKEKICVDPGIGFGKEHHHNLALIKACAEFAKLGQPLLYGVSRKSLFGRMPNLQDSDRLVPSVVCALHLWLQGAGFLRVHDVRATIEALAVWEAITC